MLDVVDLVQQQVVLHKQAPQLRALLQALQRLQAIALQEQRPQASELLQVRAALAPPCPRASVLLDKEFVGLIQLNQTKLCLLKKVRKFRFRK